MTPLLITAEEAAHRLGISRTKVYELIASHRIESVQLGRSRRVVNESLDDFVRQLSAAEHAGGQNDLGGL